MGRLELKLWAGRKSADGLRSEPGNHGAERPGWLGKEEEDQEVGETGGPAGQHFQECPTVSKAAGVKTACGI